jgi:radical SAM-linked protein
MRIALPRPVGVESRDEWLVIELTTLAEPSDVLARLSPEMPAGIALLSAQVPPAHDRMVPCGASYAVELDPDTSRRVETSVSEFMAQDCVVVDRVHHKTRTKKTVNVRRYILEMHVSHTRLTWTQSITSTGTARPDEVFEVLKLPSRDYVHRLVRENVTFSQ